MHAEQEFQTELIIENFFRIMVIYLRASVKGQWSKVNAQ